MYILKIIFIITVEYQILYSSGMQIYENFNKTDLLPSLDLNSILQYSEVDMYLNENFRQDISMKELEIYATSKHYLTENNFEFKSIDRSYFINMEIDTSDDIVVSSSSGHVIWTQDNNDRTIVRLEDFHFPLIIQFFIKSSAILREQSITSSNFMAWNPIFSYGKPQISSAFIGIPQTNFYINSVKVNQIDTRISINAEELKRKTLFSVNILKEYEDYYKLITPCELELYDDVNQLHYICSNGKYSNENLIFEVEVLSSTEFLDDMPQKCISNILTELQPIAQNQDHISFWSSLFYSELDSRRYLLFSATTMLVLFISINMIEEFSTSSLFLLTSYALWFTYINVCFYKIVENLLLTNICYVCYWNGSSKINLRLASIMMNSFIIFLMSIPILLYRLFARKLRSYLIDSDKTNNEKEDQNNTKHEKQTYPKIACHFLVESMCHSDLLLVVIFTFMHAMALLISMKSLPYVMTSFIAILTYLNIFIQISPDG